MKKKSLQKYKSSSKLKLTVLATMSLISFTINYWLVYLQKKILKKPFNKQILLEGSAPISSTAPF